MINMSRKGIKFSIQRVYFPQSYFESRHYGKRFNSIGKFKSLTFQLRAIWFHTFAVDLTVVRESTVHYTLNSVHSLFYTTYDIHKKGHVQYVYTLQVYCATYLRVGISCIVSNVICCSCIKKHLHNLHHSIVLIQNIFIIFVILLFSFKTSS